MKKIEIGKYTYGPIECMFGPDSNCKLKIGHYCSIAEDVIFINGVDHATNHLMTYPIGYHTFTLGKGGKCKYNILKAYKDLNNIGTLEHPYKGPIIVDDDVWIGRGAKIMSSKIPIEKFLEIYPETIKDDFDIDYIFEVLMK